MCCLQLSDRAEHASPPNVVKGPNAIDLSDCGSGVKVGGKPQEMDGGFNAPFGSNAKLLRGCCRLELVLILLGECSTH